MRVVTLLMIDMLHEPLHCSIFLTDQMLLILQDRIKNICLVHITGCSRIAETFCPTVHMIPCIKSMQITHGALRSKCFISFPFTSSVLCMIDDCLFEVPFKVSTEYFYVGQQYDVRTLLSSDLGVFGAYNKAVITTK